MSAVAGTLASNSALEAMVVGHGAVAELLDGTTLGVVQLNNAATTPPFARTLASVNEFLQTYGALHRGSGPFARRTCEAVERSIEIIKAFLGCSTEYSLLFAENTSGAINLFARLLGLTLADMVVISDIEHTSNNLPWRYNTPARVVEAKAFDDGSLDYADLERIFALYGRTIRVLSVTGASNQSGFVPELKRLAALAHASGALFFVDAAQLAPHRSIDMAADEIDGLALSAHKVYAPFGLGVLALRTALLNTRPVNPGGGSVDMINDLAITWAPTAERHQTGTWNAAGIVGLAASCETIAALGWEQIHRNECDLIAYAAPKLAAVPGLTLHVPAERYLRGDRIGTFPFSLAGLHYALVAAALEHEYAIEVRSGTICNHRLVRRWLDVSDDEQARIDERIHHGDRLASYGIVRASLGLQTSRDDIDRLVAALTDLVRHGPRLAYRPLPEQATFEPEV